MKNQQGFTLIEVIIALVILMFGLTGLLGMSTYAFRSAAENERWTQSRILASNQLQQLTAQPLDDLQAAFAVSASGSTTQMVRGVTYTTTWQLERLGSASEPIRITIQTTYPGAVAPVVLNSVKSFFL